MGKTIQVACDRAHKENETVMPMEIARGTYVANPPSLPALKLMHFMIDRAGGQMAEMIEHQAPLRDIVEIDGKSRLTRAEVAELLIELKQVMLLEGSPADESRSFVIGGILDMATVDRTDPETGNTMLSWWFGRQFLMMAARSEHWAILDSSVIMRCKRRSSVLLLNYVSSFLKYAHVHSRKFTVAELRDLLGATSEHSQSMSYFNQKFLNPAIEELNKISHVDLSAEYHKSGRRVTHITIHWAEKTMSKEKAKTKAQCAAAQQDQSKPMVAHNTDRPPEFPATGGLTYDPYWMGKLRESGCRGDNGMVAAAFRAFLNRRQISRSGAQIDKIFLNFCKTYEQNADY